MAKYQIVGDNVSLYMQDADGVVKELTTLDNGLIIDITGTGAPQGTQFLYTKDGYWINADLAVLYTGPAPATDPKTLPKTFFTTQVKWGMGIAGGILLLIIVVYFIKKSKLKNKK